LTDGWCSPTAFDPKDAGHFQCVADKLYTTRDGGETFSATPADPIAKLAALTVLTHRKQQKLLYLLGSSLLEVEIHE
jgi:hypothetical protein